MGEAVVGPVEVVFGFEAELDDEEIAGVGAAVFGAAVDQFGWRAMGWPTLAVRLVPSELGGFSNFLESQYELVY